MRDLVLSARTDAKPDPLSELMQTACLRNLKSASMTASRQNAATSARLMAPASSFATLTMPVGGSDLRPPGRTMQYSRSLPGPLKKRPAHSMRMGQRRAPSLDLQRKRHPLPPPPSSLSDGAAYLPAGSCRP